MAELPGSDSCVAPDDLLGLTASEDGTRSVCRAGKYQDQSGVCKNCHPTGMDCTLAGTTSANLLLKPGHWKALNSTSVHSCPYPTCVGTTRDSTEACAPGNVGLLCAICAQGFYRPSSFAACSQCQTQETAIGFTIAIFLTMCLALAVFVQINRRAPSAYFRPFIEFLQKTQARVALCSSLS